MSDGARLPLTVWEPLDGQEPRAVILALHGVNDSRAAFRLAASWWAERGIETWAYDGRGFGGAPGKGIWPGEDLMVRDLRTAVALIRARYPDTPLFVAGESMGGAVTISAFGSDDPPPADGIVLLAPAVWGWSSQSLLNQVSLRAAAGFFGDRTASPPEWLARDRLASDNMIELFRTGRDPASVISTRFDALYGLVELMESASVKLARVETPTLLLYGAYDNLVPNGATQAALRRAGPRPDLRVGVYPDGWHLLNRDLQAETVYADVEAWLRDPDAPLTSGVQARSPR